MNKESLYRNLKRSSEVKVDNVMQETFQHNAFTIPIHIYLDEYDKYLSRIIQRHWHQELQISYILEGNINFAFNNTQITLSEGEAIFINSNVIHTSTPNLTKGSKGISILFHANYVAGIDTPKIETKYVKPIVDNKNLNFIPLYKDVLWHNEILRLLKQLLFFEANKEYGYELAMKNIISTIWLVLVKNTKDVLPKKMSPSDLDNERLQTMLSYIHENYMHPIKLSDIAKSANISISECCRCFKRILIITPFQYLIQRRIKIAAGLILKTQDTMTEISYKVGFKSANYFIKQFKLLIGCTPLDYRRKNKF